jgi:hypothetical protein
MISTILNFDTLSNMVCPVRLTRRKVKVRFQYGNYIPQEILRILPVLS